MYELNPVVRRFVAINNTADSYLVSIALIRKSQDFPNFRFPASTFQVVVKPNGTATVLTIVKIFPEIGWGEYELNYNIQKAENNRRADEETGHNGGRRAGFNIRKIEMLAIENGPASGSTVNCPYCDTPNSVSNIYCIECRVPLDAVVV